MKHTPIYNPYDPALDDLALAKALTADQEALPSPRVLWLRSVLAHESGEMESFILIACLLAACAILWIGLSIVDFQLALKGWVMP